MNEIDQPDFRIVVSYLFASFRQEASQAAFHGYWLGLRDLSLPQVELAVATAIRDCDFIPPPSGLRKFAGLMLPADRAVLAWEAFRTAWRKHSWYDSVNFDDPVINATIRNLGGWCELIDRIEDEDKTDKWARREFERIYQSFCRVGISKKQGLYLPGFFERDNRFRGYGDCVPPPTQVATGLPAHEPGVVRIGGPQHTMVPLALTENIGLLDGPDRRKAGSKT